MSESYRKETLPKKSVAMKILSAYGGGVTNVTEGVEYTAFGRDQEVLRFNQTLRMTQNQSGRMEAYVGPYGVGKSFIMALFQNLAVKKNFVVMSADITRSRWFAGTSGEKQGLQLYRELIKNTAIKGKGMNAFDTILRKWYDDLMAEGDGSLMSIRDEYYNATGEYFDYPYYSDLSAAILTRFNEIHSDEKNSKAMDYFLANITRKADAKNNVGANDYIREDVWFSVLNTLSHLFVAAKYKGLILLFDQVDYLLNLQKNNRQQNYEQLLTMWNEVNEGRTEYLSVALFAAERFVDDERKGSQMYKALDDRLRAAFRLEPLPAEQMVGLLTKLVAIHEYGHGWESNITEDDIVNFVEKSLENITISGNCVRPVCMAWIKKLDDMQINKELSESYYMDIVRTENAKKEATNEQETTNVPEEKPATEFPDDD